MTTETVSVDFSILRFLAIINSVLTVESVVFLGEKSEVRMLIRRSLMSQARSLAVLYEVHPISYISTSLFYSFQPQTQGCPSIILSVIVLTHLSKIQADLIIPSLIFDTLWSTMNND